MSVNHDIFILTVDDEPGISEIICETIQTLGFQTVSALNGDDALKSIEKLYPKIALVICDYVMPGMSGFQLRERILETHPNLPFIMLSGYVTREDALRGLELKISAFFEKPVQLSDLKACILKESATRIASIREDQELLIGFVEEAMGNIERLEPLVLELENQPQNFDLLNQIFCLVHTLKGSSGYFQPQTLHHFVHKFEDFLSKIKSGNLGVTVEVISTILKANTTLIQLVGELKSGLHTAPSLTELISIFALKGEPLNKSTNSAIQAETPRLQSISPDKEIRVSIELLDEFMYSSGEMTVLRNMIERAARSIEKSLPGHRDVELLSDLLDELHKINGVFQSKIFELRKVSIKSIIKSFPRVVRDLSIKMGKEVDFISRGDDLRVDTSVGDVLSNALIHMIRNSIDHGLEPAEERQQQGKSSHGTIQVLSRITGDNVVVEVSDDGRGIRVDKIKEKMIKNGTSLESLRQLSESEILMQLFEPGFSTADVVTEVSGRGVGMDMVKKSIDSLKGGINIKTEVGKGTCFELTIPIPRSVHIINSLVIHCEMNQFGIPQEHVIRVLEIPQFERSKFIGSCEGAQMLRIFDDLYPLFDLGHVLGIRPHSSPEGKLLVVIVKSGDNISFALSIDDIADIEDTVVKPLPSLLRDIEIFTGATFMEDGTVGLILSIDALAKKLQLQKDAKAKNRTEVAKETKSDQHEIVLFELEHGKGLFGVDRRDIRRLEQWHHHDIQINGQHWVVPYRGGILRLIDLATLLHLGDSSARSLNSSRQSYLSLIMNLDTQNVGLVVKSIVDIQHVEGLIEDICKSHRGIQGSLTVQNKTVTLLNLKELLVA